MDFILFFILGYCSRDVFSYIKTLINRYDINAEFKTIVELDEEWHNDDLP